MKQLTTMVLSVFVLIMGTMPMQVYAQLTGPYQYGKDQYGRLYGYYCNQYRNCQWYLIPSQPQHNNQYNSPKYKREDLFSECYGLANIGVTLPPKCSRYPQLKLKACTQWCLGLSNACGAACLMTGEKNCHISCDARYEQCKQSCYTKQE